MPTQHPMFREGERVAIRNAEILDSYHHRHNYGGGRGIRDEQFAFAETTIKNR